MSGGFIHDAAHETVFDVDVEKLARVYALAALNSAGDIKAQQSLMDDLSAIATDVLTKYPDLEKVLGSALVSVDDKIGIIDRVFGNQLSTNTVNFLKVIAKHGRLGILRQVIRSASALWKVRLDQISVKLELAHPVDKALEEEIVATLAKALNAQPLVSVVINPDLIAGFVARVGDRVFDASTRSSLERTRQAMIARAVEAIQQQPHMIFQET